ncbi:MAG TPA: NAD(P)H-dependent oxidoreductase [Candidatus Limiplasma sp.]|nr:NAD(P)H-dependent oxidoreductase [Candidatus Limiplasma sp.]HRX09524.1 NAD(P)H-dependent oxidoreductase [Candidatus Limiplasma sp.]
MNIVAITGTNGNGCTQRMMDLFLKGLGPGHTIRPFVLPKDGPPYCLGCKTCFLKDEALCPHADTVLPIWEAMLQADMLVFAYPVYALRAPAQVKALLDHLCAHWFVHRPKPAMLNKRAVIIAQAIGKLNRGAIADVSTSLKWLGVSAIRTLNIGLMEDVFWEKLSQKRRDSITRRITRLAAHCRTAKPARVALNTRLRLQLCKIIHRSLVKKGEPLSADDRYWVDHRIFEL